MTPLNWESDMLISWQIRPSKKQHSYLGWCDRKWSDKDGDDEGSDSWLVFQTRAADNDEDEDEDEDEDGDEDEDDEDEGSDSWLVFQTRAADNGSVSLLNDKRSTSARAQKSLRVWAAGAQMNGQWMVAMVVTMGKLVTLCLHFQHLRHRKPIVKV